MGIGKTYVNAPDGFRFAHEIAGHVINKMIQHALAVDNTPIDYAIVTVPASFQVSQRRDTLLAADLGGVSISGANLLDEPIAALIDYLNGINQDIKLPKLDSESNILVFDFGGGTCDVAIMNITADKASKSFKRSSKAVSRYHKLGGADIDAAIVYEVLIPKLMKENGMEPSELGYAVKKNTLEPHLIGIAENLKIMISNTIRRQRAMSEYFAPTGEVKVSLPQTIHIDANGRRVTLTKPSLTLEEFNSVLQPFLDEDIIYITETDYRSFTSIFSPIEDTFKHAFLEKENIDFVLLVGGSCLIPQVEDRIREYFKGAVVHLIDTEERIQTCVSRGAALNALYRAVTGNNWFEPVCHQQISINTKKGLIPLISAGQVLPFPGEDIWAENSALKTPQAIISSSEDLRIEIIAGIDDEAKLLYSSTWKLMPIINKGETIKLSYNMNADQVLDIRLSLASQPGAEFNVSIENPITHIVNVNELQRKIMELEEWIRVNRQGSGNITKIKELAQLYAEQGKNEKAIEFYKRVLKSSSKPDVYVLNQLGIWYGKIKDYENQEKFYREAAKHGDWKGSLFNLALSLNQRKKHAQAIPYLQEAVEGEDDPAYYVLMSDIYKEMEDPAMANRYSDKAFSLFKKNTLDELSDFQLSWYQSLAENRKETELLKEIKSYRKKANSKADVSTAELPDTSGDLVPKGS
jgi:molecular chaperone DnaK (HSP70)